jgi:hypothetical protein
MVRNKLRHEENVYFESDGQSINVEDTQSIRDRAPLPNNPPPGPKWQAKQGLCRLNLNGAEYAVLACLIDRASLAKGACYPSQEFICGWTFRPERTVKRAVAGLRTRKLVRVVDRGTASNAYHINWQPIFSAYRDMKGFEKRHAASRNAEQKVAPQDETVGPEVARQVGPEVAPKPMKGTSEEREPMTLSGSPNGEPYWVILKGGKKERALQREQEAKPSRPHEGPTKDKASWWKSRERAALTELETCTDQNRRAQLEGTIERARSHRG